MLATVEAIVEKDGSVRLLESLHPRHSMRALLEPLEKSTTAKQSLDKFVGVLKNSTTFSGDPVVLQRNMRDWNFKGIS